MEDSVAPFERNLYGHPLAGLLVKRQFEQVLLSHGWETGPTWSVYVDEIKLAWKKQNIGPTWKIFMKDVDLGGPTTFLDHVLWSCFQIVSNQQGYCGELQRRVQIQDSFWRQGKYNVPELQGNIRQNQFLHGPMGRSRK